MTGEANAARDDAERVIVLPPREETVDELPERPPAEVIELPRRTPVPPWDGSRPPRLAV